jgi:hypothetical protein
MRYATRKGQRHEEFVASHQIAAGERGYLHQGRNQTKL